MPSSLSSTRRGRCRRGVPRCGGVRLGAGEHALDGVKDGQLRLLESLLAGEGGGAADIAEEHGGLAHIGGVHLERRGNSFLDEAFLQPMRRSP